MATFEEHIEGLTKIDITSSSTPSQSELTTYLVNGLIDCVNKITAIKPEELPKFSKTTNAVDSVAKKGRILSVLREHDSTTILRPCTPIHPSLRYEATDTESLNYRSKYNPGYYERDGWKLKRDGVYVSETSCKECQLQPRCSKAPVLGT